MPVNVQLEACCRWTTVRGVVARCRHNDLVGSDAPQQAGTQRMSLLKAFRACRERVQHCASPSKHGCTWLHTSCKTSTAMAVKKCRKEIYSIPVCCKSRYAVLSTQVSKFAGLSLRLADDLGVQGSSRCLAMTDVRYAGEHNMVSSIRLSDSSQDRLDGLQARFWPYLPSQDEDRPPSQPRFPTDGFLASLSRGAKHLLSASQPLHTRWTSL